MRHIKITLFLLILSVWQSCSQKPSYSDLEKAEKCTQQVKFLLDKDNGQLWNTQLYGPIMFIFTDSEQIIANENDALNTMNKVGNMFHCAIPSNFNYANTATSFNGKKWATITWDNTMDDLTRNKTVIHECWHRIQEQLGIMPITSNNTHLDSKTGRILLKYEFVALQHALTDSARALLHINNALTIRKYRQNLFPNNNEDAFECHEGLAEYTGYKLYTNKKKLVKLMPLVVAKLLEVSENRRDGWSNAFPYYTGPVYAILLDRIKPNWKNYIKNTTLIKLVENTLGKVNNKPNSNSIDSLVKVYGIENIEIIETELETERTKYNNTFVKLFDNNTWLYLLNKKTSFSFDPNDELITYKDLGVIYKTMTLTGDFGRIEAKNGVLRTNNWEFFILALSNEDMLSLEKDNVLETKDYKISLNKGIKVQMDSTNKYIIETTPK